MYIKVHVPIYVLRNLTVQNKQQFLIKFGPIGIIKFKNPNSPFNLHMGKNIFILKRIFVIGELGI